MAARIVTSAEIARMRQAGRWSRLWLAVYQPPAVFSARLASVPTGPAQIAYYGGAGGGAAADMTLWIGTTAGAWDKGQARLRTTPTTGATGALELAEANDIDWTAGDYLTVVSEFGVWARHVRVDNGATYMDYDVAYTNQHLRDIGDPVPVLGPDVAQWQANGPFWVTFDAGSSWTHNNASLTYTWEAPGANLTYCSGLDTATPTLYYPTYGMYQVKCTVTASNEYGTRIRVGYRAVMLYDAAHPPITQFELTRAPQSGDQGWEWAVRLYAEADQTTIRDRALVLLCAHDFDALGQTTAVPALGPLAAREQVLAAGWLAGETLAWNAEQSSVAFEVKPLGWWLAQIPAYPAGQIIVDGDAVSWNEFQSLNVIKALWHVACWRSTLAVCADVWVRKTAALVDVAVAEVSAPASSIWEQLSSMAQSTLLIAPRVDRFGSLYIQETAQYVAPARRSEYVTVQTLEPQDWEGALEIERQTVGQAALADVTGVRLDGLTPYAVVARYPAGVMRRYGRVARYDRLALGSQAAGDALARLIAAALNNEWPLARLKLAGRNPFLDAAPEMFVRLTVPTSATPRGVGFTDKRFIVRRVGYEWNAQTGAFQTTLELEGENAPEAPVVEPEWHYAVSFSGQSAPCWSDVENGLGAPDGLRAIKTVDSGGWMSISYLFRSGGILCDGHWKVFGWGGSGGDDVGFIVGGNQVWVGTMPSQDLYVPIDVSGYSALLDGAIVQGMVLGGGMNSQRFDALAVKGI